MPQEQIEEIKALINKSVCDCEDFVKKYYDMISERVTEAYMLGMEHGKKRAEEQEKQKGSHS